MLSLVIVPAIVSFLGRVLRQPFEVPADAVARVLLPTVLVPLALALLLRRLAPRVSRALARPSTGLANLLQLLALIVLLIAVFGAILDAASLSTVFALVVFVAAGLAVGHLVGGPEPEHAIVLAVACATRNPGIAIAIASAVYPAQNFAGMIILYAILGGIASKPYVTRQRRNLARATSPQTPSSPAHQSPEIPPA